MELRLTTATLVAIVVAQPVRAANWTKVSPTPLPTDVAQVVVVSPKTAWAIPRGSCSEPSPMLFRSQDGGDTWSAITVGANQLNAVYFSSDSVGATVGCSGDLYWTTDGGSHWTQSSGCGASNLFGIYFDGPTRGWAVGASGTLCQTTCISCAWIKQTALTAAKLKGVFGLVEGGKTKAWAIGEGAALYYDENVDSAWHLATNAPAAATPPQVVRFFDGMRGVATTRPHQGDDGFYYYPAWCIASAWSDKLWASADGGRTWTADTTPGFPIMVDVDLTFPGTATVLDRAGLLYSSTDHGAVGTWSAGATLFTWPFANDADILTVPGAARQYGLVAGGYGDFRSTLDGGASWRWRGTGTSETAKDLAFLDDDRGWMIADADFFGVNRGVFYTEDGGRHWTAQLLSQDACKSNPGVESTYAAVRVLPNGNVVVGGNNQSTAGGAIGGHIWRSTDGGGSFSEVALWSKVDGPALEDIAFADNLHGWVVGQQDLVSGSPAPSKIMTTADGGATWTPQTSPTLQDLHAVFFLDANRGWAVGGHPSYGIIIGTIDGGANWTIQSESPDVVQNLHSVYAVDYTPGPQVWAVGDAGVRYHSGDGSTWAFQEATHAEWGNLYHVEFVDVHTGWAVSDNGSMVQYSDSGTPRWVRTEQTAYSLRTVAFRAPYLAYAGGAGGAVLEWATILRPTVEAGTDQAVNELVSVSLDGSATDPQALPITSYLWTQLSGPTVTLTGANTAHATFTSPALCLSTDLVFQLAAYNGTRQGTDTTTVHISNSADQAPSANIQRVGSGPISEGDTVTLDGSGSSDDCGFTYHWAQTVGPGVTVGDTAAAALTFTAPTTCSSVGLTFSLTVQDTIGQSDTHETQITVQPVNEPPYANAGVDKSVDEGTAGVALDGSASSDDCGSLTYEWTQVSGPSVTILTPTAAIASFTAPRVCTDTDLSFQLRVSDTTAAANDTIVVHVLSTGTQPPVAEAGPNVSEDEATLVTLDGSASAGECGDLTFDWSQTAGAVVTLSGADSATPSFTTPRECGEHSLTFELTVTDDQAVPTSDEVVVTVMDTIPPVATASGPLTAAPDALVTLDASATDDCATLTYAWSQVSGSSVTLSNADTAHASFVMPSSTGGTAMVFAVRASNGSTTSEPAQVTVSESGTPPTIEETANLSAVVGLPYVYDADRAASATGSQPVTWSHAGEPTGLRVDANTGVISWVPTTTGQVSVTIGAENLHGVDTYTFTVDVGADCPQQPPEARIVTNPAPATGAEPLSVLFDGSQSTPVGELVTYRWELGDDSPAQLGAATVSHVYASAGGYRAYLEVTDRCGRTSKTSVPVAVGTVPPPQAHILAEPDRGLGELTVSFSCDCTPGGAPIVAYAWEIAGETEPVGMAAFSRTFGPGSYHVSLTVVDANGLEGHDATEIVVSTQLCLPPVVDANASPTTANKDETVTFVAVAAALQGGITSHSWSFGDGGSSAEGEDTATHAYGSSGHYYATFTATTDCDGLKASKTIEIAVGGPPRILSIPDTSARVGVAYRYDDDGLPTARGLGPLTWRVGKTVGDQIVDQPTGMTIDPATGQLTWTPAADQVGDQDVLLVVENAGGTDRQSFKVTVVAAPQVTEPVPPRGCGCTANEGPASAAWLLTILLGVTASRRRRPSPDIAA